MEEPSEPRRLEEMTEEERIEASDRAAVHEWLEEQTKGISTERKRQKVENYKKALDEFFDRLDCLSRWKEK